MAVQAIETRYAGYVFRSRLEARWAVYFDHLNIPWEYELEGFEVTWRLSLQPGTLRYLPDFWLPNWNVWAEVKGELNESEAHRLVNAAASLSSNGGGGCGDSGGHDVVVLGPMPKPSTGPKWSPTRLHMHKGDLLASSWLAGDPCDWRTPVGRDVGGDFTALCREVDLDPIAVIEILLNGVRGNTNDQFAVDPAAHQAALAAARAARFEYGRSG